MSQGVAAETERVAAWRQSYLAGRSYREIANEVGVSERTVKRYGKAGGWEQERRAIEAQRPVTDLSPLVTAADKRAEGVELHWRERLQGMVNRELQHLERVQGIIDLLAGKLQGIVRAAEAKQEEDGEPVMQDWREIVVALSALTKAQVSSGNTLDRMSRLIERANETEPGNEEQVMTVTAPKGWTE